MNLKYKLGTSGSACPTFTVDLFDLPVVNNYFTHVEDIGGEAIHLQLFHWLLGDESSWENYDSGTAKRIQQQLPLLDLNPAALKVTHCPEFSFLFLGRYYAQHFSKSCSTLSFLKEFSIHINDAISDLFFHIKKHSETKDGIKIMKEYFNSIRTLFRYTFFFNEEHTLQTTTLERIEKIAAESPQKYTFFRDGNIHWEKYIEFLDEFATEEKLTKKNIDTYVSRLRRCLQQKDLIGRKNTRKVSTHEIMDIFASGNLTPEDFQKLIECEKEKKVSSDRYEQYESKYYRAQDMLYTPVDSFNIQRHRDNIDPLFISLILEQLKEESNDAYLIFYLHIIFSHPIPSILNAKFLRPAEVAPDDGLFIKVKKSLGTDYEYDFYFTFKLPQIEIKYESTYFNEPTNEIEFLIPLTSHMNSILIDKYKNMTNSHPYLFSLPEGFRWRTFYKKSGVLYKDKGSIIKAIQRTSWTLKLTTIPPEYLSLMTKFLFRKNTLIPLVYSSINLKTCNELLFNFASRFLNQPFPLPAYIETSYALNQKCLNLKKVKDRLHTFKEVINASIDLRLNYNQHSERILHFQKQLLVVIRFLRDVSVAARDFANPETSLKQYCHDIGIILCLRDKETFRGIEMRAARKIIICAKFEKLYARYIKVYKLNDIELSLSEYNLFLFDFFKITKFSGRVNISRIFAKNLTLNALAHYTIGRFLLNHLAPGHSPLCADASRPYKYIINEIEKILNERLNWEED